MLNLTSPQKRATRNDENLRHPTLMFNFEFKHHQIFCNKDFPLIKYQATFWQTKHKLPLRAPSVQPAWELSCQNKENVTDQFLRKRFKVPKWQNCYLLMI